MKTRQRFKKHCNRCGELFRPTGKSARLCEDCKEKAMIERTKKIRERHANNKER